MNPHDERFNIQLDYLLKHHPADAQDNQHAPARASEMAGDAENNAALHLAQQLRTTPRLRVDPAFAAQLERRVLRHALTQPQKARGLALPVLWRGQRGLAFALSLGLLLVLLGAGVFALVAHITNAANPLLGFGQGQPTTQSTATASPVDLAKADLQSARLRLQALPGLANLTQTNAYVQALASFDTQLGQTTTAINALPAGHEQTLLTSRLTQLKDDARQQLRGWLHRLTPNASAATTSELGKLGDQNIPQVSGASIVLPAHPKGTTTVRVTGSGIQPGAQLLVNGKVISASGTLQGGQIVFVLTWNSEKHPHTLGILNPDGTVAQTGAVTVTTASKGGNGNGNGPGQGK